MLRDLREKISAPTMRSVISGYSALRASRLVGKSDSVGAKEKQKVGRAAMIITSQGGPGMLFRDEVRGHPKGLNLFFSETHVYELYMRPFVFFFFKFSVSLNDQTTFKGLSRPFRPSFSHNKNIIYTMSA